LDDHSQEVALETELGQGEFSGSYDFKSETHSFSRILEPKLIHLFDHRYSTFTDVSAQDARDGKARGVSAFEHERPNFTVKPRYWIKTNFFRQIIEKYPSQAGWLLGYRYIARATDVRTCIASALPETATTVSMPCLGVAAGKPKALLLATLNSYAIDYFVRLKVPGAHLTYGIMKQLPLLPPDTFDQECLWSPKRNRLRDWMMPRVLELTYTAWDLASFALDCGWSSPPFRWNEERRFLLRCELDAAFFHLYLPTETKGDWHRAKGETEDDLSQLKVSFPTPRDAVAYIMDTFPIVKRKDEAQWGTYRTKETILKIYDAMAQVVSDNATAEAAGQQPTARYETVLSPPPGPPMDEAGSYIPMDQLDPSEWPAHIHLPIKEPIKKPEKVSLDEFIVLAYPASDTDEAICAAALAIVEESQGISSVDHLDCLLLATHPDWCRMFLNQNEYRPFDIAKSSTPDSLFVIADQSIRWKKCRDYLEKRHAIIVQHNDPRQAINPGRNHATVRNDLPRGVDQMVRFALKAISCIADLRKDLSSAPQDKVRIIKGLEQYRYDQLAA